MYPSGALSEPLRDPGAEMTDRQPLCLVAYVILTAAAVSPLLQARVPPLVDYPIHLARVWTLIHSADIPELARNYVVNWRVLPGLAMDLVVPLLSLVMPVEQA